MDQEKGSSGGSLSDKDKMFFLKGLKLYYSLMFTNFYNFIRTHSRDSPSYTIDKEAPRDQERL